MTSKHERHLRDAKKVAEELREAGKPYEADAIARLCRSSSASMAENRRANAAYRTLMAEHDGLREEVERLRESLRLIELIGYREGEQAGWMVAHMRGVANDALEGRTSEHIWRLFPHHRARLLTFAALCIKRTTPTGLMLIRTPKSRQVPASLANEAFFVDRFRLCVGVNSVGVGDTSLFPRLGGAVYRG